MAACPGGWRRYRRAFSFPEQDLPQHPTHTPYDGSSKLFTIGLKPLDFADWIEVDGHRLPPRREAALHGEIPDAGFHRRGWHPGCAGRSTGAARKASTGAISRRYRASNRHRSRRHPRPPGSRDALPALHRLAAGPGRPDHDAAGRRRLAAGRRLAVLSFVLALVEKFGRPMSKIHAPVPGFGPGTRTAELIDRMFDMLQPGNPVERYNWSIQAGDALYHPLSNVERIDRATKRPVRFRRRPRRTPSSASSARHCASCLTRAISCSPSASISTRWRRWRGHPDRAALAKAFAGQLEALDARSSTTRA